MIDIGRSSDLRVPKTAELVAARLRGAIVRGELKPGDRLSEAELIVHYRVSRPTLREAVRILEFESLVLVARGVSGGIRVCAPSHSLLTHAAALSLGLSGATLNDVFQTRILLEPQAARFAAEHAAAPCAEALRQRILTEQNVSPDDFAIFNAAVVDFHRCLLQFCGNPCLSMFGQALQDVISDHLVTAMRNRSPTLELRAKLRRLGLKSQERLVDFIAAGDGEGAQEHWTAHLNSISGFWLGGGESTLIVDLFD